MNIDIERLYKAKEMASKASGHQEQAVLMDSTENSAAGIKLAKGILSHRAEKKVLQEAPKPSVNPYLFS